MTKSLLMNDDPAFSIRIDPVERFVEIHLKGFWGPVDLERFDATLRAMLPSLATGGCPIGGQVTLFDLTAYQVQSQEVLMGQTQMANDPQIGSRRIAVVLASGLLKLQARRAAPSYGLFDDRASAMEWLQGH